jgi:hypothetical protein
MILNVLGRYAPLGPIVAQMEKEYYGDSLSSISMAVLGVFIVGFILLLLVYYSLLPSSSVSCVSTVNDTQLLVKLFAAVNESDFAAHSDGNVTRRCLSQNEDSRRMMEYCKSLCDLPDTFKLNITGDGHVTSADLAKLCSFVAQVHDQIDLSMKETPNVTDSSWCWSNIDLFFNCLSSIKDEL